MKKSILWLMAAAGIVTLLVTCKKEAETPELSPEADFVASQTIGTIPFMATFDERSANKPTSWHWDFGDGNTSSKRFPMNVYQKPGTYTVELTVQNSMGTDTKVMTDYITVEHDIADPAAVYGGGVVDIDGNEYTTVLIGEQEWMASNLRVTRDPSGNDILRQCLANDPLNCDLYGGLYAWNTVMNRQESSNGNPSGVQGVCPDGWHVPSEAEWAQLIDYVEAQGYINETNLPNAAGNALKSCRKVDTPLGDGCRTSMHPRWNANDEHHGFNRFGFSALPGGVIDSRGVSTAPGYSGYWWSSTMATSEEALHVGMYGFYSHIFFAISTTEMSLSVRCLKD